MVKKGFTLMEMIVVVSIIAILSVMATPSLLRYFDQANQMNRTEAAKTIYLAAQNQLTQMRALGNLKGAYAGEISGKYFETDALGEYTDELDTSLETTNNVYTQLGDTNYPDTDIENGKANHVRYISKAAYADETDPLYQFLQPVINDPNILNGTILIEYNIVTGKILSVFFSDVDDVDEFSYILNDDSDADIQGPRGEEYDDTAVDRRQGYYGVGYTGEAPPEELVPPIAINIYDGYDDGHDDSVILPGVSRYNKSLDTANDSGSGDTLENVLYAEIFIEKSVLTMTPAPTFDLSISALPGVVMDDIVLSDFTDTTETFEDALMAFEDGSRTALIYRNDLLTGDPDFARFIWVLDYVGGDMSSEWESEKDVKYKYSIANMKNTDGAVFSEEADLANLTGITASIVQSDVVGALPTVSNEKHPLFADNTDPLMPDPDASNIATARHLNNIRYTTSKDDVDHVYTQIANIDFAADNGVIEFDGTNSLSEPFAEDPDNDDVTLRDYAWNLKLSPLPTLYGTYTGEFSNTAGGATETGMYTIQNMNIFNVNYDTAENADLNDNTHADYDPLLYALQAEVLNRSVGLFEMIAADGEISHLTFIDPYLEVKNTHAPYGYGWQTGAPGTGADDGKYAGVVTGYSSGSIHHITVMSNSEAEIIHDRDDGYNDDGTYSVSDRDTTNITNDYVGGIVGMIGVADPDDDAQVAAIEDAIHHVLFMAIAPSEEMGTSHDTNRVRYDYPIVGTYLTESYVNSNPDNVLHTAIDDDSCYYLVGELLRPYTDTDADGDPLDPVPDHQNLNIDRVTDGFGKQISTNEIYADMQVDTSDFYKNFMMSLDGTELEYAFVGGVADALDVDTISSEQYPYPYFGTVLTNNEKVDLTTPDKDMNFTWPIAELEAFKAEFVYYEVYGNLTDSANTFVGYYQEDDAGNVLKDTLINTDVETEYRILNDGYAVRVNRSRSMLEDADLVLKINGLDVTEAPVNSSIGNWLNRYVENWRYDEFNDMLRLDPDDTSIQSVMAFNNGTFHSAVASSVYNEDTDVMHVSLTNDRENTTNEVYINPLYAKAIYQSDATDASAMTYSVRSPRHLNNIGRSTSMESVNSNFIQEIDINLDNYGAVVSNNSDDWSYSIGNLATIYMNLKWGTYGGWSNLYSNTNARSVSATVVPLAGTYDGGGKTIKNLVRGATDGNVALFEAIATTGVVQNLTIDNFNITPQGLTVGATVATLNEGTIQDVLVTNSTVTGTFNTWLNDSGGTSYNRPSNVGGVVAENGATGIVDNVTITNSQILRDEVGSVVQYGIRSYGAGGIIGDNSGTLTNSGAVNTTVTVYDNFAGGLVGIVTGEGTSLIEDNYFIHSGEDASGNPVVPVGYDSSAVLTSANPRYSIGGIVGGIVNNEWIASGSYVTDTGTVNDNLYMAIAPTNPAVADTIYPVVGAIGIDGFTLTDNVFLSGTYYSNDNATWKAYAYNTLAAHGASLGAQAMVGAPSASISGAPPAGVTVPYAANGPAQHTSFDGNGTVTAADDSFTARMLFGGNTVGFVNPDGTVTASVEITNTSGADINLNNVSRLNIAFGDYADYIDLTALGTTTLKVQDGAGTDLMASLGFTVDASNVMTVDTAALSSVVIPDDGKMVFLFDIKAKPNFTSGLFTDVPTDYYHIATSADIEINAQSVGLTSDKLHIQPTTSISKVYNGGTTPVPNDGTNPVSFTVETTLTTSNLAGYVQSGVLTDIIPSKLTLDESTLTLKIDGNEKTPLTAGTDYTVAVNDNGTPDASDDFSELKILNLAPTVSVEVTYELTYVGVDASFKRNTTYNVDVFKTTNNLEIASNVFTAESELVIGASPTPMSLFSTGFPVGELESPVGSVGPVQNSEEPVKDVTTETGTGTGDGSGTGTGDGSGTGTGDGSGTGTGDGSGTGTGDGSGTGTGDGSGTGTGDGSGTGTGDGSGTGTGDGSGTGTGDGSGTGTGDGSGTGTGDGSGTE